jgi:hypothetical protein
MFSVLRPGSKTTIMVSRSTSPNFIAAEFAPMSATRILIFGGIALIAGGMLFGDVFAVFVLHQNGGQTGQALTAASRAVAEANPLGVKEAFGRVGGLLEDRGTKVDAHVHMTDSGYLALLLALIQPYLALRPERKRLLAWLFVTGGALLPIGIFLIHYVGLAYSPWSVIGWASILADSAGALLIAVLVIESWALGKHLRTKSPANEEELRQDYSWERRTLLAGGTLLILLGFLYGAWYAGVDLYEHEARETRILQSIVGSAANGQTTSNEAVADYGALAAERAVKIAAHSHIIEFGLLAILLSFIQPYVYLRETWKRRWVIVLLAGSVILPVFVLLELKLGLLAGGIADLGGLMVVVALIGTLAGIVRFSGSLDANTGVQP